MKAGKSSKKAEISFQRTYGKLEVGKVIISYLKPLPSSSSPPIPVTIYEV